MASMTKSKATFFYDKNSDGKYSGKDEFWGIPKLDKKAEYCHDLKKGHLRLS